VGGYNYYAYFVARDCSNAMLGDVGCGVGTTTLGPGIRDCPYGTMYVIPNSAIDIDNPTPFTIRFRALRYYGLDFMDYEREETN